MAQLQIIGAPVSNYVWAVRMFAEEKGAPYEIVPAAPHQGEPGRINPFGKIPVMRHGDFELSESRAIAGYIDMAFPGPRLFPQEAKAAARVEQWIAIGNAVCDPCFIRRYVVQHVFPTGPGGTQDRVTIDKAVQEMPRILDVLDKQVAGTGYLAGDAFSYADCNILPMVFYLGRFPEGKERLAAAPNLTAYLRTHMQRPCFQASKPPPPPPR